MVYTLSKTNIYSRILKLLKFIPYKTFYTTFSHKYDPQSCEHENIKAAFIKIYKIISQSWTMLSQSIHMKLSHVMTDHLSIY